MEEFIQERIGQTLGGRWVLQSVLGVGGMAAVYAAIDSTGREAAVKILHPEIGMRRELRERFMREGTVANLIQHPGAVRVLEHGAVDDRSVFLVLERLHGASLGDRVAHGGMLPLPDLLDVLDQVLDVLVVAHGAGIIHRDLKPDNLFLTEEGQVKVLDFGLARLLESAPNDLRTRTGIAMGTLPYMAPEQALGKRSEIDGRVDIFALGATAFRLLTKRRIHDADSEAGLLLAMASKAAPPLRSVAEHVPASVAAIVDLALAFNRDARYPDARTMQEDVRAAQRAESPPFAAARVRTREEATRGFVAAPVAMVADQPIDAPTRPEISVPPSPPSAAPVPPPASAAAAVTPSPVPGPQALPAEPTQTSLTAAAAPHSGSSASRRQTSPLLLALIPLACLLLGGLLWAMWPSSDSPDAEATDGPANDTARAVGAAPKAALDAPTQVSEPSHEQKKKQQEQAREQKKAEELLRGKAKKEAESRGGGKK